jgi:hypothetical protein
MELTKMLLQQCWSTYHFQLSREHPFDAMVLPALHPADHPADSETFGSLR